MEDKGSHDAKARDHGAEDGMHRSPTEAMGDKNVRSIGHRGGPPGGNA